MRMCPTVTLIIFVVTIWINLCEYLPVLAFQLTPVDSEDTQVLDSIRQLSSDSEYAMNRAAAEIEGDDSSSRGSNTLDMSVMIRMTLRLLRPPYIKKECMLK